MAIYTKLYTLDLSDGGNTVYVAIDKLEDNIDDIITNLNACHMTTRGDMIYRGASSTSRLAIGSAQYMVKCNGTDPAWGFNVNWERDTKLVYSDDDTVTASWPKVTGLTNVNVDLSAGANNTVYYLHLLNSITGQPVAGNFQLTTNTSETGYINVGVVITDGSGDIREFYCPAPGLYIWDDHLTSLSGGSATTFTDVNLTSVSSVVHAPTTATSAILTIQNGAAKNVYLNVNGSTGTTGHLFLDQLDNATNTVEFPLASGIFEYKTEASGSVTIYTNGFRMF